ncbi:MAG: TolC family protein [Bacteroidaceae bacterium]|nr:TolC family protein [Bacteroidaceae bacterium]
MKKKIVSVVCAISIWLGVGAQTLQDNDTEGMPESWSTNEEDLFDQTLPVEDGWWKVFGDGQLDSLISLAMQQNLDVDEALSRIEQARFGVAIQQGNLLPSIGVNGGWARQQSSGNTGGSTQWSGQYNLKAQMSWELDLFGNIRQRIKAQEGLYQVSEEEFRGVMVSLCAQVATTYFNLRQYQQEREVLEHNCESQLAVLRLTEARYSSGLASRLDVAQAQQVYYGTLSQLPAMKANISHTMNQLAVLLGQYPQDVVIGLESPMPLPNYIEPVQVGIPAGLLLRRPDIRQAEKQVEAQAALLGAAKREWFPQFFLNGSIGYASTDLNRLIRSGSVEWEIAPSMSWTLFNGGQRYYTIKQNRTQLDQTIISFNRTVLQAMQEVTNAMSTYAHSIEQIVANRQAFNYSQQALSLSLDLYKQGLTTFQSVLDAQRSLLSSEESLVQARGYSLTTLVQMYQALGGGWR